MPKHSLALILLLLFCYCASSLRFCSWAVDSTRGYSHLKKENNIEANEEEEIEEHFRSYHPHYLHSYSYPRPVTPHFYIGQKSSNSQYVFLVKYNDSLREGSVGGEILAVNGKKESNRFNNKSFGFSNNFRANLPHFMLVLQIENLFEKQIETKIELQRTESGYLKIKCVLEDNIEKYFVVALIDVKDNRNEQISLFKEKKHFTNKFFKFSGFSNQEVWQLAHENIHSHADQFTFENEKLEVETFGMEIQFRNWESASRLRIGIWEMEKNKNEDMWLKMENINFSDPKYKIDESLKEDDTCDGKALKQLLQGLSYEYGTLILKNGSRNLPNEPKPLLSLTPSRKRFPWGFLWDDGFHCELLSRHNPSLTLKIIKSWLDSMEENGWIPREQNRGKERELLCSCPPFMAKDVKDGNPPTLMLGLLWLAKNNKLNSENFSSHWPKLEKWYNWFLETQMSEKESYIFKWRDSVEAKGASFNSGMDDFPRLPSTTGHVDCQSWMYFFATSMEAIGKKLNFNTDRFKEDAVIIRVKFFENFIDEKSKIPFDFHIQNGVRVHNENFGYPSLLPLCFGMLEKESSILTSLLNHIKEELDSNHGLTSLSMKNRMYLENRNAYWRGPVWLNINYLVLRGLQLYYPEYQSLYKKLRDDLTQTVCGQEKERGYFFENYINGYGSFSYPFTGWTALIALIIQEKF